MALMADLRTLCVFGPILGLLLLGFLVSLKSGVASVGTSQGLRLCLNNLSQVLIRIVGYVAGLAVVQQLVGLPISLGW